MIIQGFKVELTNIYGTTFNKVDADIKINDVNAITAKVRKLKTTQYVIRKPNLVKNLENAIFNEKLKVGNVVINYSLDLLLDTLLLRHFIETKKP